MCRQSQSSTVASLICSMGTACSALQAASAVLQDRLKRNLCCLTCRACCTSCHRKLSANKLSHRSESWLTSSSLSQLLVTCGCFGPTSKSSCCMGQVSLCHLLHMTVVRKVELACLVTCKACRARSSSPAASSTALFFFDAACAAAEAAALRLLILDRHWFLVTLASYTSWISRLCRSTTDDVGRALRPTNY